LYSFTIILLNQILTFVSILNLNTVKVKIYIKYLISGGTAAAVNLFLLFIFHKTLGLRIVYATTLAFVVSFFVSFYAQKYWTFNDNNRDNIHKQMSVYLVVALINLLINALSMYGLVEVLGVWYMLAQFITSGAIAIESFVIYRHYIFNQKLSAQ
jgi:putative flippase GtrA